MEKIICIRRGNQQPKDSSRSWMTKTGIRRYYRLVSPEKCPRCGQALGRVYRLHPFLMPEEIGRGMWLKTDCKCSLKDQVSLRKQRDKALVQPQLIPMLPPALRGHTFANFKVDSYNQDAFKVCVKFAKHFGKNKDGKGLIICGKAGRGKTHLACAIINQVGAKYTAAFAHIPSLLEKIRQGQGRLDQLLTADLLILDDLGSERESDWALEKLLIIADGRLNHFKATVYTTNYNFDELELRIGSRLASRILYNSYGLVVQGPDWREIKYRMAGDKR